MSQAYYGLPRVFGTPKPFSISGRPSLVVNLRADQGGLMRFFFRQFSIASGLVFLLAASGSAHENCSNRMLRGHYAHLIEGAFGPSTTPFTQTTGDALPFRGIQMLEFDGKGGLTGSESLVAGGGELTNNNGKHFVPVVGSFTINDDCTGVGFICSNHTSGLVSGGANTCDANNTIDTPGFVWEDFVQVTIVLAERGKKFHMLVVPPYDSNGVVRTISSTGTRVEDDVDERSK